MRKPKDEEEERIYELCQDYLGYITTYKEKDTFYHATLRKNVDSILQQGFDPSRIGTGGGCQGGAGFSCAWCALDAKEWGEKLYSYRADLAILKITIPNVKLASQWDCHCMGEEAMTWGREQGYIKNNAPTEKLTKLYRNQPYLADPGWALIGQYVRSQGYDGYFVGLDEVVIMNFGRLKPEAFTLLS